MIYFRHKDYRKEQKKLIEDIAKTIEEEKIALFEAPTGLGKTDAAISSAISKRKKESIFFITPKNSQHKIAIDVIKGINKKYSLNLKAISLLGKSKMCLEIPNTFQKGFYELCESKIQSKTCKAYLNYKSKKAKFYSDIMSAEEINELSLLDYRCPYYSALDLAKKSDIIICDYNYIFSEKSRKILLQKANKKLENSIIIIDEAHNLAERLRNNKSIYINKTILSNAKKEYKVLSKEFPEFEELSNLIEYLERKLNIKSEKDLELNKEYIKYKIELLPILNSEHNNYLLKHNLGSAINTLYEFIAEWHKESSSVIRYYKNENNSIYVKDLNIEDDCRTVFEKSKSSILMSATLSPLSFFKDILGIKEAYLYRYKNNFPESNKKVLIYDKISTKYSERNKDDLKEFAKEVINANKLCNGNTAVFCPSHKIAKELKNLLENKGVKIFLQDKNSEISKKILNNFKKLKNAILIAVLGGSFSEGIDLPGEELNQVFILGIPFPEPSIEIKKLIEYYDKKYAKGWDYAYLYPTFAKVIQAAGRCIRTEEDKGIIVFADKRYNWRKYKELLPNSLQGEEYNIKKIENFFSKGF